MKIWFHTNFTAIDDNGRYKMLYVIRLWQTLCVSTKYGVDISVDMRHCKHYINQYGVIHRKYSKWEDIKYFMYVKRSHNLMIHKILLGSNKKMRICQDILCNNKKHVHFTVVSIILADINFCGMKERQFQGYVNSWIMILYLQCIIKNCP